MPFSMPGNDDYEKMRAYFAEQERMGKGGMRPGAMQYGQATRMPDAGIARAGMATDAAYGLGGQAAMAPGQEAAMGSLAAAPAATGPSAAAAGAGAGGMAAAAPWLAVAAQYLDKQRQAKGIRQGARESIGQQRVAELGYPTYGIQAAEANRNADQTEGADYLQYLLPFMGQKGLSGRGMG